jgi:hypothetical protein
VSAFSFAVFILSTTGHDNDDDDDQVSKRTQQKLTRAKYNKPNQTNHIRFVGIYLLWVWGG